MGVDLTYTLGGRKVSRNEFFKGLEGEIRKAASDTAIRHVQSVRCSKHGENARVTQLHQTRDGFSLDVSGCCDDLIEAALGAIG